MRGVVRSRRGMSPLIATVLLMAFAVALGGVIIQIGTGIGVEGECGDIKVIERQFCREGDKIVLRIDNTAKSVPLQGIVANEKFGDRISFPATVKDSALAPGGSLDIRIPIVVQAEAGETLSVEIIGIVGSAGAPHTCSLPVLSKNPLPPCA